MASVTFKPFTAVVHNSASAKCRRSSIVCSSHASAPSHQLSRRDMCGLFLSTTILATQPVQAAGFKKELKKRKVSLEDYATSDVFGLKYLDEAGGTGAEIQAGDRVVVHFDVMYRGIDVASSRYSRLLGGNRTIAEPFEFIVGEPVAAIAQRKISEGANGLFSGQGGPEPPVVLSTAVIGMKDGGKRVVRVDDAEKGYGKKRVGEMEPGQPFDLKVEVLQVYPKKS